jgi:Do/DeqQ family serine protease
VAPDARAVPATQAEVQMSFAPVVKRVSPAVVNVYASRTIRQDLSPMYSDPFFRQFFGGIFGGQPSQRVQQSLGSGVIISADGLIVTNFHVIAEADQVKVALSDKREFPADIVLKDQRSDLAVLKIKGSPGNLPTIEFADSDQVQVGDLVLAIGDPFGIGQTVTSGIVSAFALVPGSPSEDQYFIQTDAAINPGNSGGALVDMQGRLIGINRMIVSPSGASSGIGFAIPSNLVRTVTAAAATGAPPQRPWFGAELQSLTPELAASLSLDVPNGVLVASVAPGSPAATANLQPDDLIVSIDGSDVDDLGSFNYHLATKPLGGTAKLGVVRSGQRFTAQLALVAAPETPPRDQRVINDRSGFSGLTVLNLSPAVADELSYDGTPKGVIVSDVADGSNAADVGFQRGDVIATLNGARIDSTATLINVLAGNRRYYDMTLKRDGEIKQARVPG